MDCDEFARDDGGIVNTKTASATARRSAGIIGMILAGLLSFAPGAGAGSTDPPDPADPGGARGYRKAPSTGSDAAARALPQLLLLPARIALNVVTYPVRVLGGAISGSGVVDHIAYGMADHRYFLPVAGVDPSFGRNAGFHAAHHSSFDRGGYIHYRAAWGGTKEHLYAIRFASRQPFKVGWTYNFLAKYEIIPDKHYFGLGNISRYEDRTFYTDERYLFLGKIGYSPVRGLRWDLTYGIDRHQIEHAAYITLGEFSIEHKFPSEAAAPGLHIDPQDYWGEIALTFDQRNSPWKPTAGWLLEGFFGYSMGAGSDDLDYVRYGGEGHAFLPLGNGRVLALRGSAEEARSADGEIKFNERPSLGGPTTLRGYLKDRFRDNAAVLATAEYRYPIAPFVEGTIFADFGKVMFRILDFDMTDIHRSWGMGLRLATHEHFLFHVHGAYCDENYVITASIESAFNRTDRRDR